VTVAILVLAAIAAVLILGSREYERHKGNGQLASTTAELDGTDPGWRLEEIEASRVARLPPPGENSAKVVREAAAVLPPNDPLGLTPLVPECAWHAAPPSPNLPPIGDIDNLTEALIPHSAALSIARKLHDYPRGGTTLALPEIPFVVELPHTQNASVLFRLVRCDAELAALGGDSDEAIGRSLAVLNAGRSVGDEPFAISQLVRLASGRIAARTAIQTMAWGQPTEVPLARLQAELTTEGREPILAWMIRGERAVGSATFDALRTGVLDRPGSGWKHDDSLDTSDRLLLWWSKGALPADQAKYLQLMTQFERGCRGAPRERIAAAETLVAEVRSLRSTLMNSVRYRRTTLLVPATRKLVLGEIDARAEVACACVGIACERFRLRTGRWPSELGEIPEDLIAEIPADPYGTGPLQYRRLPDGVMIYSVGLNGVDDEGQFARIQEKDSSLDIGCRLWDVNERRRPPSN
jgi:hypothetical protein